MNRQLKKKKRKRDKNSFIEELAKAAETAAWQMNMKKKEEITRAPYFIYELVIEKE